MAHPQSDQAHDGARFLVVDYKTNHLGPLTDPPTPLTAGHYAPERLAAAMTHSSYPLQALLYAVVAHRFLRWWLRPACPRDARRPAAARGARRGPPPPHGAARAR